MRASRVPTPPVPGGFGFPFGVLLATTVTVLAVAAGATTHPDLAVVALAGTTATVAAVSTLRATLGTAAVAWALHAGFVLGRHGELAFTAHATLDAIVLCATAVFAFIVATAIRVIRDRVSPAIATVPIQGSAPAPLNMPDNTRTALVIADFARCR